MKAEVIKQIISGLELPANEFVLFGGSTLALAGIRDAKDIDLFVTDKLYKKLADNGWKEYNGDIPHLALRVGGYEVQAFSVWNTGSWKPRIQQYLIHPESIAGLHCMPIKGLYKWKEFTRRDKDLRDIELIERYWAKLAEQKRSRDETPG